MCLQFRRKTEKMGSTYHRLSAPNSNNYRLFQSFAFFFKTLDRYSVSYIKENRFEISCLYGYDISNTDQRIKQLLNSTYPIFIVNCKS